VTEDKPVISVNSRYAVTTKWTVETVDGVMYEVDEFDTTVSSDSAAFMESHLWTKLQPAPKDKPPGLREHLTKHMRGLYSLQKQFAAASAGAIVAAPTEPVQHIEGLDDPVARVEDSMTDEDPTVAIREDFNTRAAEFVALLLDAKKAGATPVTIPVIDEETGEPVRDKKGNVEVVSEFEGTTQLRELFAKRGIEVDEDVFAAASHLRFKVLG
jgi:hypothetical protein